MMRDTVIEIVLVHVEVHPDPFLRKDLVVLGARQRREKKEFENVERQLAGEAENVAGISDGTVFTPFLEHLAIFGDFVLALLAAIRLSGLMFSSPMKTRRTPACVAFSMKFGIL